MHQTEWIQIDNECFEECEVVLSNGETLFTIRRWDVDTVCPTLPDSVKREVKPMGNIRVALNGQEMFFTPLYISRDNLIRRVRDYLGFPFNDLKNICGVKTPHFCNMLPKAMKQEIKDYLSKGDCNDNEDRCHWRTA